MASFTDFLSTFDSDTGRRGRQFEHFVKWYLKTDPIWSTQVDHVWLWDEYPGKWGRDKGIDLIFKDRSGRIWAVQAKCYSADYQITKADLDTFLSETSRKHIDNRLLIATTDRIGTNGKEVLDGQEKPVVRFLLNDFESAAVEYPDSIDHLALVRRKSLPIPRPHQIEAVNNIVSGFESSNRGQVIMACGTGKTFVCLWAKERLKAKRTLVLLPSLGLLSQTLSEWTYAAREPFGALCVCSDQTVGRRDSDEAVGSVSELPFPVTIDTSEIASFLEVDRPQVIFSTYQSSPLIAAAQADKRIPHFDLIIADEAHRCAGKTDTAFYTPLDDEKIRAKKRLFVTATPRVYRTSLKKAAEDFGVNVADMNDEKRFGTRFHTLSFGEAIRQGLLTDYRVLIVGVDNTMIAEWIKTRRLVSTETGHDTDAESLAAQIAVLKSMKDWNLHRVISFHGRVKRAKEFSEGVVKVAAWIDDDRRPLGTLWSDYVSGEMPAIARKRKLMRLKAVGSGETGLLSNARCLSEGVDVPALDGVAFIDPRGSEIDIIQSVGRAIRLSEHKTLGTIVLPVFIQHSDDARLALENSSFNPIWKVLEALKSHDERLSDELDELRLALGAKRTQSLRDSGLTRIYIELPTGVDETFVEALRVHLVNHTTSPWFFWLGLLENYVLESGHSRVPDDYITTDGLRLGKWVGWQRHKKRSLSADRRSRLEGLAGWSWSTRTDAWERGFAYLCAFTNREGHCRVLGTYRTADGYRLGQWVSMQRTKRNRMDVAQRLKLESLPGWSWNLLSDAWERGFEHLKAFAAREGHCRVPDDFTTDDGYALGTWVGKQRTRSDALPDERRDRFGSLPGWSWDVLSDGWELGFAHLVAYCDQEEHCRVPRTYKATDGYRLGQWVTVQRSNKLRMKVSRRKRLEALRGWSWDPFADAWQTGFDYLRAFAERHGHSRVPVGYVTDSGYRLGLWVVNKRSDKNRMPADRKSLLETVAGWSWDVRSDTWEEGYTHLKAFSEREGHCRVPQKYRTAEGYGLGAWVSHQRASRDKMVLDRRQRLEALPGWIWQAGR